MKLEKPIFKNTTKGRIQIIVRGVPVWLEPGDTVVGENFRVFTKLGLEQVGKEESFLEPKSAPVEVSTDDSEDSPVQLREVVRDEVVTEEKSLKITDYVEAPEESVTLVVTKPEEDDDSSEEDSDDDMVVILDEEPEEDTPLAVELVGREEIEELLDAEDEEPQSSEDDVEEEGLVEDQEEAADGAEEEESLLEQTHPFACDECDKRFGSERGLKTHKRWHKE